jgi:hypothetical protein
MNSSDSIQSLLDVKEVTAVAMSSTIFRIETPRISEGTISELRGVVIHKNIFFLEVRTFWR